MSTLILNEDLSKQNMAWYRRELFTELVAL